MKLCIDCKWYMGEGVCAKQVDPSTGLAYPDKGSIDPVTGEGAVGALIEDWRARATLHREDGWLKRFVMGTCGRRARWFEAKKGVRG